MIWWIVVAFIAGAAVGHLASVVYIAGRWPRRF